MLALLALSTVAVALDSGSMRADDTSSLFRDPYDLILRPGQLGLVEGRQLHTLMSEPASGGELGVGYAGQLGTAVLGVAVTGRMDQDSQRATSHQLGESGEVISEVIGETWDRSRALDLAVAAAGRQGAHLSLGAAAELELSRSGYSLAEGSIDSIGAGSNWETWSDGELVYAWDAERWSRTQHASAVLGLAHELGGRMLALDGLVGWKRAFSDLRAEEWVWSHESQELERVYQLSGSASTLGLAGNHQGWGPGLRVEAVLPAGQRGELIARATGKLWMLGPVDTRATERVLLTSEEVVVYDLIEGRAMEVEGRLLVAGGLDLGKLHLRGGARAATWWDRERTITSVGDGRDDEIEDSRSRIVMLYLPTALEAELHERWTLRIGARWWQRWAWSEFDTQEGYGVAGQEHLQTDSGVMGALGLRFTATEQLRLDLSMWESVSAGSGAG